MWLISRENIFGSTLESRIWTDHDQSLTDRDYPQLWVHPLQEFILSSQKHHIDRLCLVSWSGATCCCVQKAEVKPVLQRVYHIFPYPLMNRSIMSVPRGLHQYTSYSCCPVLSSSSHRKSYQVLNCVHPWISFDKKLRWKKAYHIHMPGGLEPRSLEWGVLLNKGRSYMEWAVCPAPRGCA